VKPPIIVGFDVTERTLTIQFEDTILDHGYTIGGEYHDPEVAALRANAAKQGEYVWQVLEESAALRAEVERLKGENERCMKTILDAPKLVADELERRAESAEAKLALAELERMERSAEK